MKAVVAAFNQEMALVGAFCEITNLRMELFEALVRCEGTPLAATCMSRGRVLLSSPPTGSMLQEMSARPGPGHTAPALSRVLSVMIVCLKMTAFRQPSPSSSRYQYTVQFRRLALKSPPLGPKWGRWAKKLGCASDPPVCSLLVWEDRMRTRVF